jgi:hypothetical protein
MKRKRKYLRWHPSHVESLNRYTMTLIHEHALKVNARIDRLRCKALRFSWSQPE